MASRSRELLFRSIGERCNHVKSNYFGPLCWDRSPENRLLVTDDRFKKVGELSNSMDHLAEVAHAMERPRRDRLHGSVEFDETYVGGIENGVRGRGTENKFIVVIAIEVLSPKGFGRVGLQRVKDVSGAKPDSLCLRGGRVGLLEKIHQRLESMVLIPKSDLLLLVGQTPYFVILFETMDQA
jgi:hypothetical protein